MRLALNLSIDARHAQLRYVGQDNKGAREFTSVPCLGTLNNFRTKDHIETTGHTARGDLVGIFLDADFLPVAKAALFHIQLPLRAVLAHGIEAHERLSVAKLLFHIGYTRFALDTRKGAEDQFGTDLRGPRHRAIHAQ